MDTLICDISAWQYHTTPDHVRHVALTPADIARARGSMPPSFKLRRNAAPAVRAIVPELLGALKGVDLPAHVACAGRAPGVSPQIVWHERAGGYRPDEVLQVGEGLYVTTLERTLLDLATRKSLVGAMLMLFEACGLYAVRPKNARLIAAFEELGGEAYLRGIPHRLFTLEDTANKIPVPSFAARSGSSTCAWEPCYSAKNELTSLWKRPPLTSLEQVKAFAQRHAGAPGATRLARAAGKVLPGSASPAESLLALMLTASRHIGGENLRSSSHLKPTLNQRITLSRDAAAALGHPHCVADQLWPGRKRGAAPVVVEVDGWTFHDRTGEPLLLDAKDDGARANALRGCGYEVIPVTYSQMANADRWELLVALLAEKLDVDVPPITPAFLRQRARLRQELFGTRPDRCVGWGS